MNLEVIYSNFNLLTFHTKLLKIREANVLSLSCLILRSMSALDLSLAAKMIQKVQSRKRRKCANDIARFAPENNRIGHFSQLIVYIWKLCVMQQPGPNQADRAWAGNFVLVKLHLEYCT